MEEEKKRKMPTLTFSLCLLACFLSCSVSAEITVKPGDDVTLQCQSQRDEAIILFEWIRPDLKTDGYVFFFRENRSYENYQHPSFRDRVQLIDPEMKDGNVSVILKNVTINDTGTYKCHVSVNSKRHELINTINLTVNTIYLKVTDSGHTAGNTWTEGDKDEGKKEERNLGLTVGLSVAAVLVVAVIVGFVIYRQRRQRPGAPVPQQD
ncbi:programmed cell death 1 ligand 1-like isoform X2 [Thunnus albacares]|uniref:programmed cell death 1 ligand 1-like isoform X2 n=1 Tax=Thunnus albacares TaxID=8236 RepID=UPI001CF68CFD|nr:programmed cell death 1 ligand 1-like isoform X2 [Thunnus albacares]